MSRDTITFEVDRNALFDTLAKVGDGGEALGQRLVETLLLGEAGFRTAFGLEFYGISLSTQAPAQGDVERIRAAAFEEAARAVEQHDRTSREWIPGSLWDQITREAATRIRALQSNGETA